MNEKNEELNIIEPEQHFLHTLIIRWDEIGSFLYNPRVSQSITVRKAMMAFISRLPNNEKETVFKNIYHVLNNGNVGEGRGFYAQSYIEIYGEISKYLGETYFKSFRVAKPTHSKGYLGMPNR